MKKTGALLVFFTMILAGCTADEGAQSDGLPYYRFTENDLQKLMILPTVGDTKIYQNQDGETITFTIYQAEQGKPRIQLLRFGATGLSNIFITTGK